MKALICDEPGRLSVVERPRPDPGPGEVLVRIRRVGICGTDFHILQGKHPFLEYPRVMGHELSGTVQEAPPGSALKPGDPVYIVPYLSCGTCQACRIGLTNACCNIRVLGVHCDGGMAELVPVPEANVIPTGDIPIEDAAMIEFLAIGAHGIRRGGVTARDRVLVTGAGPIGMSALLTTTMPYMKVVIDTMKEKGIRDDYVVLVGGAPLNEEFGEAVGADAYCRDAAVAVETAKDYMKRKHNLRA